MDTHLSSDTSDPARASSRIYVGNLKKHIEREDLQKLFSKYGEIQGISLHKGGFGFVQFKEEKEADAAVKGEGGVFFKGCLLQLRVCSSQDSRRSYRGTSRERDREYSDHDRRHEAGMPRDRSPVHRDYDEREFKRDDRYGGRDERGYGRDDPHRPYPRPEGNGRYGRDGYWSGRDEYGGHHGRDEPPMGYGRDEQPAPRSRMDPVPVPPPFRPETDLRKPNDCEIIVLHRQNRNYAEMVERRLKNLGMQVDLLFLKDEALLSRALEDLTQRGTLFAVVVTDQHEVHGSVTVNILYGVPQEHRNMPLDDSLKLVARHFREQVEAQQAATGGPDRLGPDRELQFLLKLLVDSKYLSIPELDRIIKYLTERRDKQLMLERGESAQQQPRTVSSTAPSANVEPERPKPPEEKPTQQELQQRILSMIGQPTSPTTIVKQAPLPTPVQQQPQPPAPAGDVPTSTYINFDNPSVQKALDNLIHNGSNLLKTLSSANSGASPALGSHQPSKPLSGYGYGDGEAYSGSAPGINSSFGGHVGQQYQPQRPQQPPPMMRGPGAPTAMRHPLMGTQVQRPMMSAGRPGSGVPRY
ncbi:nuclear receptor coactivator 5-like isoform X4 [Dermacentor silvarum]|uniref:nuclear receptor coactivator 5-like isoform X4 n=1 Tax=Dermacentor silvarum TaxID=543639 RepID=UPI002101CC13|nr:nuclear receptor coactivator 5-like isoform X4 [Dermacentor silvarum]